MELFWPTLIQIQWMLTLPMHLAPPTLLAQKVTSFLLVDAMQLYYYHDVNLMHLLQHLVAITAYHHYVNLIVVVVSQQQNYFHYYHTYIV